MSPLDRIIIYIDMDHTLCDYSAGYADYRRRYPKERFPQSKSGFYRNLEPLPGAIETFHWLNEAPNVEVFILTAPSLKNPHSYSEKRLWVEDHLGFDVVHRLIISAHKGLNRGHYLIDDCDVGKGQEYFEGELIQFGSQAFSNWFDVRSYLESRV